MKMKYVYFLLAFYITGSGPWCAISNYGGNLNCFYYSYDACASAADGSMIYVGCVLNPRQ
jgi:hypothetical protein